MNENREYLLPRKTLSAFLIFGLLVAQVAPAFCQALERNWAVDCSVKMEYVLGAQRLRQAVNDNDFTIDPYRFRADHDFGLWAATGLVEVSALPRFSVRLSGTANIQTSDQQIARFMFTPIAGPSFAGVWAVQTLYRSWEVAGSYHFVNDGFYRFGVCGGYRQERWIRQGTVGNDFLSDTLVSNIPFFGLQTAIFQPGWTARFEILGSPFMHEAFSSDASWGGSVSHQRCKATQGGLVEVQFFGAGWVTQRLLWGITAKYNFQGLYGPFEGVINDLYQGPFDGYLEQSIGQVGLLLTLLL